MKASVDVQVAIMAIKRAIVGRHFKEDQWLELGVATGCLAAVQNHSRLLRSLHFGDPDYAGCVFEVIQFIVAESPKNLHVLEKRIGLADWLQENDGDLYSELYGASSTVPLDELEAAASILNVQEFNRHATRIRESIGSDEPQAIGSSKELLESVLKAILGEHGHRSSDDLPDLLKRAQLKLEIDPKSLAGTVPGAETIKRTLSNLGQLVLNVGELRNIYGTGHGRSRAPELDTVFARLVVNSAITAATFFVELWQTRGADHHLEHPAPPPLAPNSDDDMPF